MSNKSNPIAKNLILILGGVVVVFVFLFLKNKNTTAVDAVSVVDVETIVVDPVSSAPPEELPIKNVKADSEDVASSQSVELGVEGDNANDTIRTLNAKIESMEKSLANKGNEQSLLTEKEIDERVNSITKEKEKEMDSKVGSVMAQLSALKADFANLGKGRLGSVNDIKANNPSGFSEKGELPISKRNGLFEDGIFSEKEPGIPRLKKTRVEKPSVKLKDDITWIKPIDSVETKDADGNTTSLIPKLDNMLQGRGFNDIKHVALDQGELVGIPFATIPRGSTAIDTVSLTALIGRIPVGGQIVDPFKFKVLLSE